MKASKIKITKCLFPCSEKNWKGVPQPEIEGMYCITFSKVKIDGKEYEQFEYIPNHLNLCNGGNAKRIGNHIHLLDKKETVC
ncbi:MAG: hypothetical protein RLZ10_583 [Bacteroidota bacterium]|jgi:hypothetical protein